MGILLIIPILFILYRYFIQKNAAKKIDLYPLREINLPEVTIPDTCSPSSAAPRGSIVVKTEKKEVMQPEESLQKLTTIKTTSSCYIKVSPQKSPALS